MLSFDMATLEAKIKQMQENLYTQEKIMAEIIAIMVIKTSTWTPPLSNQNKNVIERKIRIRKINEPINPPDIVSRVKKSWVGYIYKKFVKKIPLLRWLVILMFRTLYPVYINLISFINSNSKKSWKPLVKLLENCKESETNIIKVYDSGRVETPVPGVMPNEGNSYLKSPHVNYVFPEVYVAKLKNVEINGGTNLIFTENQVICHDLYDFSRDYTSEEMHGRHIIDAKKLRIRVLTEDKAPERIREAATFVDACASNYAHWMTEVLPRIVAFCTLDHLSHVPVIINEGLHANLIESVALVAGEGREIITLPLGRTIQVEQLYATSVAGYVPFSPRNEKGLNKHHGLFSSHAVKNLAQYFHNYFKLTDVNDYPEKIYIRRKSLVRNLLNSLEIESFLIANDYTIIEPEKLNFIEQIKIFSAAKIILGSAGAAMVNLIFMKPGQRILIIMPSVENTIYWYWQNMACASDFSVNYIFGDEGDSFNDIHSDFSVDLNKFKKAVEFLEENY
jgi:capsular polysaccharide biosynthesis protein